MVENLADSHSRAVMTCEEAHTYEASRLDTSEKVWKAMCSVGRALGRGIVVRLAADDTETLQARGVVSHS